MTARRLIVMRHAKSSWETGVDSDHERPLNKRGRRDAPRVAARLVELGWGPEVILSSDATRTRETCELMLEQLDGPRVIFTENLYLAGVKDLADQIAVVPDPITRLLVLGHNPGWEEAVEQWSGEATVMKTACAALLEGSGGTWGQAIANPWKLISVVRPKELAR